VTGRKRYGYVYAGWATVSGEGKRVEGTAWSLGPCDEVRLRAAAVRDLSRSVGAPLAGIEITDFWFSEIAVDDVPDTTAAGADPFRPDAVQHPCQDPFRPYDLPDA
jgi:hypothetical protein